MEKIIKWEDFISKEKKMQYFKDLSNKINEDKKVHKIFPPREDIFNAFKLTPFDEIKVVIIGQDPYHEVNQAHGLAFSVKRGVVLPPSLKNIYKEIEREYGYKMSESGDLSSWAKQGVLLLNTSLTVCEGLPASHKNYGWEQFTTKVVQLINQYKENVVFLLWGNFAKQYEQYIDKTKHLILKSSHPSPLSVRYGFMGCNHFKLVNEYLSKVGEKEIDWKI